MCRDTNSEVTPPTSPTTYRRQVSREENVFSRLTSATSSIKELRPDTGTINPHSGRVRIFIITIWRPPSLSELTPME